MNKLISLSFILLSIQALAQSPARIHGELKQWHKVTLDFEGPEVSETDDYNPFFNYRLTVAFKHSSGKTFVVPGYFAADGNAGNTSASSGNSWRAHFSPDLTGEWTYRVDFRKGRWVAVSERANPGIPGEFMDGATGAFEVTATDKIGRDFRAKGRLSYVGEHYLQFEGTKGYFLKQGPDAPENLLSYVDFDGTFHNDGHKDHLVKSWEAHEKDWSEGDPTWQQGKGKAIIGAMNYLASKGLNVVSFLTLNIMGDDQNVFPYIDYDTYDRFDVSKLDQWEIVFDHAQRLGIFLHFKTQENENQGLLDNGGVGAFRKLYYRELIARFGHHLALNWNMGEESGDWVKNHKTPPQFQQEFLAMAEYFYAHDPYHHHIVIHNGSKTLYDDILVPGSKYTGPSLQTTKRDFSRVHDFVLEWRNKSSKAGKKWAVALDEPGDAQHSLLPDVEDAKHDTARANALWGAMMAGAWGVEWYFGYKHDHSDLTCQDYRSRDLFWDQCKIALDYFNTLPFIEMDPADELLSTEDYCFAKKGEKYVVYLRFGGGTTLDLAGVNGEFEGKWFNPRTGNFHKRSFKITGGKKVDLSAPKKENDRDWVIELAKI